MSKQRIHPDVTEDRVIKGAQESMFGVEHPGLCIACGADHDACEPDARKYECYECGKRAVYGCEWLLIAGMYHPDPGLIGE